MFSVEAKTGTLTVDNEFVAITRTRFQAWGTDGARGVRRLPIDMLTAVQLRPPGNVTSGFLQFRMAGGTETKGGTFNALKDENAVVFDKRQLAEMEQIRDFIEARIRLRMQVSTPRSVLPPPQSASIGELRELAKLRDEGILTDEEFAQQKARLLSR